MTTLICAPEELGEHLHPEDVLWVPCRTPAQRMIAQKDVIARHLEAGGTVIALGESRSDLNPQENLIRCFYCQTNFNPIDFTMAARDCDFVDAVQFLLSKFGNANPDCR